MGRRSTEQGDPISIRLKKSLVDDLKQAAKQLDLSLHDTIRKCLRIGLAELERIDFDEVKLLIDSKSKTSQDSQPQGIAMLAAEESVSYKATPKSRKAGAG